MTSIPYAFYITNDRFQGELESNRQPWDVLILIYSCVCVKSKAVASKYWVSSNKKSANHKAPLNALKVNSHFLGIRYSPIRVINNFKVLSRQVGMFNVLQTYLISKSKCSWKSVSLMHSARQQFCGGRGWDWAGLLHQPPSSCRYQNMLAI